MKSEIHRTRAIRENTRIAFGADLHVERHLRALQHRLDLNGQHSTRFLDTRYDALGHCGRRGLSRQIKLRDGRGILHRADQALHVPAQLRRIAPRAPCDDDAVGIDHELTVRRFSHGRMKHVIHRVCEPVDRGTQASLGFGHMHQPLLEAHRGDVVVVLRVRKRFVDVIKLDTFRGIVSFDRLQTGDVT